MMGEIDPKELLLAIGYIADELKRTGVPTRQAFAWADALLTGYRVGDPIAAAGMVALGEEDCRTFARQALELQQQGTANGDLH